MKTFKIFGISEVLDNKGYLAPIALSNDGNNFVAMLTTSGARYHLFFEPRKSPSEVECKFKSTQQMAELLNTHVKRFNASQTGICSLYSRYRNGHSETRSASSYPIYAKFGFDMTEPGPIVSLSGKLSYKCDDDVVITDAGGVKAICNEQNEITSVSATIDWSRCSSNPIQENNLFFDTKTKKRDVYLVKQTKTTWTDGGYSIDTVTCTSR